ncbi:hypothetical protein GE09DRAFT_1164801 [Coniochaeta sp. 2T2.1]|nr:hypothetical protein GE09DRAFT_1164801 [Coniochaeta sp. 2T2.1]
MTFTWSICLLVCAAIASADVWLSSFQPVELHGVLVRQDAGASIQRDVLVVNPPRPFWRADGAEYRTLECYTEFQEELR